MKQTQITYYLLAVFGLMACSDETGPSILPRKTTVTLEVSVEQNKVAAATRAEILFYENYIGDLDIVFFGQNNQTDYFHSYDSIDLPEPSIDKDDPDGPMVRKCEIEIPLDLLSVNRGARIMIFANCRDSLKNFIKNKSIDESTTREFFQNNMYYEFGNRRNLPFKPMPMCGIYHSYIIADGETEIPIIKIGMQRIYARIDLGVDIYSMNPGLRKRFVPREIYTFGYHPQGMFIRRFDDNLSEVDVSKPNIPAMDMPIRIVDDNSMTTYGEIAAENGVLRKWIYLPESEALRIDQKYHLIKYNKNGDKDELEVDDSNMQYNGIFMVIKASVDYNITAYYRIDFKTRYGDFLPLLRNHMYEINITKVNGYGYSTLEEAKNAKPIPIDTRSGHPGIEYEINIK